MSALSPPPSLAIGDDFWASACSCVLVVDKNSHPAVSAHPKCVLHGTVLLGQRRARLAVLRRALGGRLDELAENLNAPR